MIEEGAEPFKNVRRLPSDADGPLELSGTDFMTGTPEDPSVVCLRPGCQRFGGGLARATIKRISVCARSSKDKRDETRPLVMPLKALILVGGFGTRLRPLTLTLPKPLVEFANKPIILHQLEALVKAGVKHIVLAVNYRPEVMVALLSKCEQEYGIEITFSVESEPLGTAGPLALAREVLGKDDSPFFVLNSDVTCSYPFEQLRDFHMAHGDEGTIMVTKVDEPSKYGVVVQMPNSTVIDRFVEKPVDFVGNRINAGIYMFSPKVLDRIELRPTSIEKETFPALAADRQLHAMDLEGFWMDVGQPKDMLAGTALYLSYIAQTSPKMLVDPSQNKWVHGGNVMVDPTAEVHPDAVIGPNVVIGPKCVVGAGARLQRCIMLEGSKVKEHSWIHNSIIGWHSVVGRWVRMENVTVLGDDVSVKDELTIVGASVLPHKSISSSITTPSIVIHDLRQNPRSRIDCEPAPFHKSSTRSICATSTLKIPIDRPSRPSSYDDNVSFPSPVRNALSRVTAAQAYQSRRFYLSTTLPTKCS
ncbi:uncharacterized protein L969DRAFT_97355 [Mixia osmundae IAM 14324]|uniref:mannose-1-phosphate guanylyltransferase n=1 Tax=Mixia osmundae (strain CBS 9802 / IAM 14324 / JCM 22182 / KY 12970) TaxID=764103 RepID=G7DV29_MIXOS|nr:uncharacterized protein L969DRAFT_97355 [Mixia osmundae IAM 14324]KEI36344.1 hypothetical protein L969DRAFT_97355 [Mixia osmundae IAM 14324]GAA94439.1 hypothetical protein E5Q_01091 [Mixia osmundae IAM 14324]